jgi:hypothetical protein
MADDAMAVLILAVSRSRGSDASCLIAQPELGQVLIRGDESAVVEVTAAASSQSFE